MEGNELVCNFISFSENVAYINTVHLKEHIFKSTKVKNSPCKFLITSTKKSYYIFSFVIRNIFIHRHQTLLHQKSLLFNLVIFFALLKFLILFLFLFESFIDGTYKNFERTWLVILDVNCPIAILDNSFVKLPVALCLIKLCCLRFDRKWVDFRTNLYILLLIAFESVKFFSICTLHEVNHFYSLSLVFFDWLGFFILENIMYACNSLIENFTEMICKTSNFQKVSKLNAHNQRLH